MRTLWIKKQPIFYFLFLKTRINLSQLWYQANLIALKNWRSQLVAKQAQQPKLENKLISLHDNSTLNKTLMHLPWFDTQTSIDFTLNTSKQYKFGFDTTLWSLKKKQKLINMFNVYKDFKPFNYESLSILQLNGLGFKSKTSIGQWSQTFLLAKQHVYKKLLPSIDNTVVDLEFWELCDSFADFDFEVNPEPEALQTSFTDNQAFDLQELFQPSIPTNILLNVSLTSTHFFKNLQNLIIFLQFTN